MEGIVMKNIQERAKEWSEHIVETTPYDVVNGEVCVFAKDRDIADVAEESYIAGAKDQKAIEDAELHKLKSSWEKVAEINHDRDMKSIKERAKLASENYACDDRYSSGFFTGYVEGATEQQAIDEEVRLKKSDDMTEKQLDREEHFTSWYFQNVKGAPTFSDAIEWARKQTIDEVCDWLHLNLPNIEYTIKEPKPLRVSRGLLIDELKKAMDK